MISQQPSELSKLLLCLGEEIRIYRRALEQIRDLPKSTGYFDAATAANRAIEIAAQAIADAEPANPTPSALAPREQARVLLHDSRWLAL